MSVPEPLRYNPFRVRRRRSLDSSPYGDSYSDWLRPRTKSRDHDGTPVSTTPTANPRTYMSGYPEDYVPDVGFMETSENPYQPYEDAMLRIPISSREHLTNEFRMAAMELAGIRPSDEDVRYEDSLMTEELFQQQLDSLREEAESPPVFDANETAQGIWDSWIRSGGIKADHHLTAEMFDIKLAIEQTKVIPMRSTGGQAVDETMDYEQGVPDFFEQQQILDSQFGELQPEEFDYGDHLESDFDAQEALFDMFQEREQMIHSQPMEEMNPLVGLENQTLEQIIQADELEPEIGMADDISIAAAYEESLMDQEPFEQKMQKGHEQMAPQGTEPDPFQHYGGIVPQGMYDEQMQEMLDPFMIPGFYGPMPFGPMDGPGPGGP